MTLLLAPTDDQLEYLKPKLPRGVDWHIALERIPKSGPREFIRACTATGTTALRLAPSTFLDSETKDSLSAIPIPPRMRWETLEETLALIAARGGVLDIAPLIWHTEFLAHDACRLSGVPLSVTQPENMPLALSILKQVEMEVVIVGHRDYDALVRMLREKNDAHAPTIIFRVTPLGEVAKDTFVERDAFPTTLREIHALPGCPLFFQTLSIAGRDVYHLNNNFLWEQDSDGSVSITALTDTVLPVCRYVLPLQLEPAIADTIKPVWRIKTPT